MTSLFCREPTNQPFFRFVTLDDEKPKSSSKCSTGGCKPRADVTKGKFDVIKGKSDVIKGGSEAVTSPTRYGNYISHYATK